MTLGMALHASSQFRSKGSRGRLWGRRGWWSHWTIQPGLLNEQWHEWEINVYGLNFWGCRITRYVNNCTNLHMSIVGREKVSNELKLSKDSKTNFWKASKNIYIYIYIRREGPWNNRLPTWDQSHQVFASHGLPLYFLAILWKVCSAVWKKGEENSFWVEIQQDLQQLGTGTAVQRQVGFASPCVHVVCTAIKPILFLQCYPVSLTLYSYNYCSLNLHSLILETLLEWLPLHASHLSSDLESQMWRNKCNEVRKVLC